MKKTLPKVDLVLRNFFGDYFFIFLLSGTSNIHAYFAAFLHDPELTSNQIYFTEKNEVILVGSPPLCLSLLLILLNRVRAITKHFFFPNL